MGPQGLHPILQVHIACAGCLTQCEAAFSVGTCARRYIHLPSMLLFLLLFPLLFPSFFFFFFSPLVLQQPFLLPTTWRVEQPGCGSSGLYQFTC